METPTKIVVTGLPVDIRFNKLLNKFRTIFKKTRINRFWIKNTTETEGSQHVILELANLSDAKKARNVLNGQSLTFEMMEYPMEAHLEGETPEASHFGYEDYGRRPRPKKRNRPRSQSPGYGQEASKLDMEIELLRKQRLVIEEERKLLVEQKKLEMLREYGPSASREFDGFDDYEPRKKRQPEPVAKRPRPWSPNQAPKAGRPNALPAFFQPCKKLIADMKPYIEKDTTPEEVGILIKLIRAAIRKKLAIALDGQGYMPTAEVLKLYREKHPKEDDEAFVRKILDNIRASYLTNDINVEKEPPKKIKTENASDKTDDAKGKENETNNVDPKTVENDSNVTKEDNNDTKDDKNDTNEDNNDTKEDNNDTKEDKNDTKEDKIENHDGKGNNDAGDEVANNEIATKDTANGENETDASAPDVTVKAEPNTSQELDNISAENLSEEAKMKNADDALLEAVEDALGDGAGKAEDWLEDWNAEETKEQ